MQTAKYVNRKSASAHLLETWGLSARRTTSRNLQSWAGGRPFARQIASLFTPSKISTLGPQALSALAFGPPPNFLSTQLNPETKTRRLDSLAGISERTGLKRKL